MKIDGIFTDITLTGALFPRETDLLTAVIKMNVYSLSMYFWSFRRSFARKTRSTPEITGPDLYISLSNTLHD